MLDFIATKSFFFSKYPCKNQQAPCNIFSQSPDVTFWKECTFSFRIFLEQGFLQNNCEQLFLNRFLPKRQYSMRKFGSTFICIKFQFRKQQRNINYFRSLMQMNFKNKHDKRPFIISKFNQVSVTALPDQQLLHQVLENAIRRPVIYSYREN